MPLQTAKGSRTFESHARRPYSIPEPVYIPVTLPLLPSGVPMAALWLLTFDLLLVGALAFLIHQCNGAAHR